MTEVNVKIGEDKNFLTIKDIKEGEFFYWKSESEEDLCFVVMVETRFERYKIYCFKDYEFALITNNDYFWEKEVVKVNKIELVIKG